MVSSNWTRLDARTLIRSVPGKLSAREQEDFRRRERLKGEYDFIYSHSTGTTAVKVTEHPEWTGEFAKKKGAKS